MSGSVEIRLSDPSPQRDLISEWDTIGPLRDRELASGSDRSFSEVLKPWILGNCSEGGDFLEIGCGTGRLATDLWSVASHVTAIDPSGESVRVARQHDQRTEYHVSSLSDWVSSESCPTYDVVIANMVLMDVRDLGQFLEQSRSVLNEGVLISTFTHPAFWPRYWGYESSGAYRYDRQLEISAPFRTRNQAYGIRTTHYHRPMGDYLSSFISAGFQLERFEELRGPENPEEFPFPRFVATVARVQ